MLTSNFQEQNSNGVVTLETNQAKQHLMPSRWMDLLKIQERLQKSLEPFCTKVLDFLDS